MKRFYVITLLVFVCAQVYADSNERSPLTTVPPVYPEVAKQMKIGGTVKLRITIDAKGAVTRAELVGGNPMLVESAEKAVLKWKYAPSGVESTSVVSVIFNPYGK